MYPHQAERLDGVLARLGVQAVIATSPANVAYVTGFRRLTRPQEPTADVFAVYAKRGTALVIPAVEAPALTVGDADADHVLCHGALHVDVAERADAEAQRRRLPLLPVLAAHGARPVQVDAREHLLGGVAEHHDARREHPHRPQRVLEQRAAVDLRELLDAALEAPPRAGAQHERADPHMPSSMSSASSSSDRIELPGSSRSTYGSAARIPRVRGS
jgi:Xaa-Pro aminopeptidase